MSFRIVYFFFIAATQFCAADQGSQNEWNEAMTQADALHVHGKFAEAVASASRALSLAKAAPVSPSDGVADSKMASSHYTLGSIYRDWGRCEDAQTHYGQAKALWAMQADTKREYVFSSTLGMIASANDCGNMAAFEKLYESNIETLEHYGAGPLDRAKILALHAVVAQNHKHFAEAEAYYRQALRLLEETAASKPTDLAEVRSGLATIVGFQGRHEDSLAETERAITILESVSPQYFTLPSTMNNAACQLFYLRRKEEAARMFQRALQLASDLFGEDSRTTAKVMLNYAVLLVENNEKPAADALKQKGLRAYQRALLRETQVVSVESFAK